jgi:hypothetical protein
MGVSVASTWLGGLQLDYPLQRLTHLKFLGQKKFLILP